MQDWEDNENGFFFSNLLTRISNLPFPHLNGGGIIDLFFRPDPKDFEHLFLFFGRTTRTCHRKNCWEMSVKSLFCKKKCQNNQKWIIQNPKIKRTREGVSLLSGLPRLRTPMQNIMNEINQTQPENEAVVVKKSRNVKVSRVSYLVSNSLLLSHRCLMKAAISLILCGCSTIQVFEIYTKKKSTKKLKQTWNKFETNHQK